MLRPEQLKNIAFAGPTCDSCKVGGAGTFCSADQHGRPAHLVFQWQRAQFPLYRSEENISTLSSLAVKQYSSWTRHRRVHCKAVFLLIHRGAAPVSSCFNISNHGFPMFPNSSHFLSARLERLGGSCRSLCQTWRGTGASWGHSTQIHDDPVRLWLGQVAKVEE